MIRVVAKLELRTLFSLFLNDNLWAASEIVCTSRSRPEPKNYFPLAWEQAYQTLPN